MGAAGSRVVRRAWRALAVVAACAAPWGCAADGDVARSDAAADGAAPEIAASSVLDDPALSQRPVALWFWAPG